MRSKDNMFFSKFLRSKIEAKNILVHAKDHFFGESVLQIPFFRSLRSRFPNAKITLGISFGKSPYRASLASIAGQYVNDVEENLQICKSYRNALPFTQIPLSDKFFDLIKNAISQGWHAGGYLLESTGRSKPNERGAAFRNTLGVGCKNARPALCNTCV